MAKRRHKDDESTLINMAFTITNRYRREFLIVLNIRLFPLLLIASFDILFERVVIRLDSYRLLNSPISIVTAFTVLLGAGLILFFVL